MLIIAALIALTIAYVSLHVRRRRGRRRLQARAQEERAWQAMDEDRQWRQFAPPRSDDDESGDANRHGE